MIRRRVTMTTETAASGEVGLTCLPPLVGSHESPRRDPDGSMESRLPGRINCQKSPPSRPETGKHKYVTRPKSHARSDIWQFFTDDESPEPVNMNGSERGGTVPPCPALLVFMGSGF